MLQWSVDGKPGGPSKTARAGYEKGRNKYQPPPYHGKTTDEMSIVEIETVPRLRIMNSRDDIDNIKGTNDVFICRPGNYAHKYHFRNTP
jgi:hypothetical protein